ncbi:FAD/NAD(P)-binding protein [Streptomyces sp. NPDC096339]|uniref:FAD/NAD(P)-binding protein n=1 Tax=Streptomyces sp. NPDC096339 TaxID=3366086 RepID=UPI00380DEF4D
MTQRCLAIVGGGPMCTYAVAHLAALLPHTALPVPLHIVVYERGGRAGAGEVHSDAQARTGYLNRVAGQIAFAPDESHRPPVTLLPRELRPTLLEWCAQRLARTGDDDLDLLPTDVPRRYVHGTALREMFTRYTRRLAALPQVTVEVRESEVTGVRRAPDGRRFLITDRPGGAELTADEVLFVTGHSHNTPSPGDPGEALWGAPGHVAYPYPLSVRLTEREVPPGEPAVVLGLGLTAIDVLLHLTEGRGGRFEPDASAAVHGLRYVPSGREPSRVIAVSPSGVPVSGRPLNEKTADPDRLEHTGVYFTARAVRTLRERFGVRPRPGYRRQLDFDLHLFPLVLLEMAYVHHRTLHGPAAADARRADAAPVYRDFLKGVIGWGEQAADALIAAFEGDEPGFDWRAVHDPLPGACARGGDDGADWGRRVAAYLREDLAGCREGNLRNPLKAACDGVWRDLRAVFAEAVDHGGLTAASHRRFLRVHLRHYNRLSNGAGLEPMRKLMALLDAGLLDLTVGPGPEVGPLPDGGFRVTGGRTGAVRTAAAVVEGRVHPFDPHRDVLPLYRSLLAEGLVRQWRNPAPDGQEDFVPGGLDLDDRFHPLTGDGVAEPALTFLGAPAEGVRVFQQSAARPCSDSSVLAVAVAWAEGAVGRLARPVGAGGRGER